MRVCGLVMALTIGLILMMNQEVECRGNPNGLPAGLGPMVVAAGSTARMHGLALGRKPAPSLPPDDDLEAPAPDVEPLTPPPPPPPAPLPSPEPSSPPPLPPQASPGPSQVAAPEPSSSAQPLPPNPSPSSPTSPLAPPPTPTQSAPSPSSPPSPLAPPPQSSPTPPPLASPTPQSSPPPSPSPSPSPSPPSPQQPSAPPSSATPTSNSGLEIGFYKPRCPIDVEPLLATLVQKAFTNDPTILPALLRMQFHDCFVHGCDASILLDGPSTEKKAGPNLSVRGYELIDSLKAAVEEQCPGLVSCADIIAIATKEVLKLGGGPDYAVETGRRDGLVSKQEDVILPSPDMSASLGIQTFAAKNFTVEEMVVLLGCHTVGIAHCVFFQDRLYPNTGMFDPNMDPTLRRDLIPVCPQGTTSNNFTFLDQNPPSANLVDNSFFIQILKQRGILEFDQVLGRDPSTIEFVQQFAANETLFKVKLAETMVKLQAVDILTGDKGQIRKVCSRINP